jgi:fructokinase
VKIGIDLGGTKIEGIAIEDGQELLRRRIPTPRGDYSATIRDVCGLISDLEHTIGRRGTIGVGIPGALSARTGLVKNANSTWLIGKPLDRDLALALERPVRVMNDANCFALSEATDGAGRGAGTVFGVIIGTGVGGGIVVDRRVLDGRHRIAGEWGHNPLPWARGDEHPGPACYCGRRGCIEAFVSGPALSAAYTALTNQQVEARQIPELAAGGDIHAARALDLYEARLARALASIINVLDPDVIVLGGGLSNMERLYTNVPALWQPFVFSDSVDTPLVPAHFGDSSGVRGAAWLWRDIDDTSI